MYSVLSCGVLKDLGCLCPFQVKLWQSASADIQHGASMRSAGKSFLEGSSLSELINFQSIVQVSGVA